MALPELTVSATGALGECLYSAMNALALSITAYKTGRNLLQHIASRYEHTLRLLRKDLQLAGSVYRNEQVAAVMCLALLEVENLAPRFYSFSQSSLDSRVDFYTK